MISSRLLAETIYELAQEEHNGKKLVDNLMAYLASNHLVALAPEIINHLDRMREEHERAQLLTLTSAKKVPNAMITMIAKALQAKDAPVQQHVDAALQGGFIAEYQGVVYDTSLTTQLTKLKQVLTS